MEALSFITKSAHDSSINSLKTNSFCDAIYKLLDFELLNEVSKSLSYITGSRYLYTGRIVFNKNTNEIEVYYKGSNISNPIYISISPDEKKNKNGLKMEGLKDQVKKFIKVKEEEKEVKEEEIEEPEKEEKEKKVKVKKDKKKNISEKVDYILNSLDEIIKKEVKVEDPVEKKEVDVSKKVNAILSGLDKVIENEKKVVSPKKKISENVSKIISSLDAMIEKENEQVKEEPKKTDIIQNLDQIISGLDAMAEAEKKEYAKSKNVKKILTYLDQLHEEQNNK